MPAALQQDAYLIFEPVQNTSKYICIELLYIIQCIEHQMKSRGHFEFTFCVFFASE